MKVTGSNPDTGEKAFADAPGLTDTIIKQLASLEFSKKELQAKIDNLPVSADAKILLYKLATGVIKIGSTAIKVGQKLLECVMKITSMYPNASFGLVFGAIAGTLVGTIPIIGVVLGPVVAPLFAVLGLTMGVKQDFLEKAIQARIQEAEALFKPLRG